MQAQNQAQQLQAQFEQQAGQTGYQGQFTGAGIRQAGASGLSGLGSQVFGQGMQGVAMQQQAAERAQQQQQAMLDAARAQTAANLGYGPMALQTGTGILGGLPQANQVTGGRPGLFGILGSLGGIF